jgi:hypothetical protein
VSHQRTCGRCSKEFAAKREHARFCSDYCRVTYWRSRKSERQQLRQRFDFYRKIVFGPSA